MAIAEANKPIRKTLRPCKSESKNWDTTENLYIEGDNLEVLKLLQESYLGKVKMIYIDPPYNTGNDFIYRDDFKQTEEAYNKQSGMFDENDNRLLKNTETNGRFHSDWCSMIYSRLMLAKNFLSDDGVIFISIDENEVENLQKISKEIFGSQNFIATLTIINNLKGRSDDKFFATCNEFIIVCAKNKNLLEISGFKLDDEELENDYNEDDGISPYKLIGFRKTGTGWERKHRPYMYYPVFLKDNEFSTLAKDELALIYNNLTGKFDDNYVDNIIKKYQQLGYTCFLPLSDNGDYGRWRWGVDTFNLQKDINLGVNKSGTLCTKMRATIEDGSVRVKTAKTLWYKPEYDTGGAGKLLKKMFSIVSDIFNNPKSIYLMKDIMTIVNDKRSIIMDFFSGSATTAHAVMQLNAEDGGNRKFIMVQLPEVCDENSEAFKAGYKNICEIGKERIRRAGEKIKADNPLTTQDLDIGFRVFKVDSSNMNDVYYSAGEYTQDMLAGLEDNIKPDRTDLDLLFGCLLDWGLPISLPYTSEQIENCTVHTYNDGDLIACFDENVPETVIKEIAKRKPLRAVFRDASFSSSPEKINVTEIFKMLAPDTDIKVI